MSLADAPPDAAPSARERDADLVALLAAGRTADAFTALVPRYDSRLYRLCLTLLRQPALAEEAAQDSLLRAWRALPLYDPGQAALSTWLYTITRRHCLNLLQRPQLWTDSLSEPAVEVEAGQQAAQRSEPPWETTHTLAALVAELPDAPRCCLQLYYYEDRSVSEVATMLGLPEGSVKTHLHRGRARLMARLQALGLDQPALWLGPDLRP